VRYNLDLGVFVFDRVVDICSNDGLRPSFLHRSHGPLPLRHCTERPEEDRRYEGLRRSFQETLLGLEDGSSRNFFRTCILDNGADGISVVSIYFYDKSANLVYQRGHSVPVPAIVYDNYSKIYHAGVL
jgi:hypothetical protein